SAWTRLTPGCMRGSAAKVDSISHSICAPGSDWWMSCTTGNACTTSPIDDVLTIKTRISSPARPMCLLLLRHQRRVETRVVVHLELAVDLEVRAPGAAIGQQRVEASREIGALLVQALQLARARLAVRVVDVAPLGLQAHGVHLQRQDGQPVDHA